jgi:signal recognition particle subunit SRP54
MFETLTEKLQTVFRRLRGRGQLSEPDVRQASREIRLALLEADVNFRVVKDFIARVEARAVGREILESLTPGQQVVKIVNEELIQLLGAKAAPLDLGGDLPVVMLVGLQGGGKTTSTGKLGRYLMSQGYSPLLVATDVRRPAAIEQLQVVGQQIGLPVFARGDRESPLAIAQAALSAGRREGRRPILLDTQGRTHVDSELMAELAEMREAVSPREVLLVVDAMTGQDAVNVAGEFQRQLGVTGFILTKLDGDARGGAALSLTAVTGQPIKFIGVGEKLEALEPFHPDRMASRILGLGDVLTLIERAEAAVDEKEAADLERKLRENRFDLEDFLAQIQRLRKMGSLDHLISMIPGIGRLRGPVEVDSNALVEMTAIVQSMTPDERADPSLIDGSRRRRIARGSGRSVQGVNQLLAQFRQMKQMIGQFTEMERRGRGRGIDLLGR